MIPGIKIGAVYFFLNEYQIFDGNNFALKSQDGICVFCNKDFFYASLSQLEYFGVTDLFVTGLARIEYIIEKAKQLS
jgi:hypothetical protein